MTAVATAGSAVPGGCGGALEHAVSSSTAATAATPRTRMAAILRGATPRIRPGPVTRRIRYAGRPRASAPDP
ncbi:hypothetical protein ABA31_16910 [Agrococcus baldri]|uniref:Uncharacterized protein n=1 Tax=Agrococcus baldri TaxID=153730 RepID=A0AA87USF4_9MICO|nr:hypothetical protein ABA31_16910 [Agrococcus baldri]